MALNQAIIWLVPMSSSFIFSANLLDAITLATDITFFLFFLLYFTNVLRKIPPPKGRVVLAKSSFIINHSLTAIIGIAYLIVAIGHFGIAYFRHVSHSHLWKALYAAIQGSTWLLSLLFVMYEKKLAFPVHHFGLRVWWVSSFLLHLFAISSLLVRLRTQRSYSLKLALDDYASLGCMPLATALVVIALRGYTGVCLDESVKALSNPLLSNSAIGIRDPTSEDVITGYAIAGSLSKAVFSWINPLLSIGSMRPLQIKDIPQLNVKDRADNAHVAFQKHFQYRSGPWSVAWALMRSFCPLFLTTAMLALVRLCTIYIGPLLIQSFIDLTEKENNTWYTPFKLVLMLLLAKFAEVLADHQYSFLCRRLSLAVKSSLIASIYQKGLCLSNSVRQVCGTGKIVNHMTVDVRQIADMFMNIHDLWSMPMQIVIALLILYKVVRLATLVGLGTMALMMLFCLLIASQQQKHMVHVMTCKDNRIKVTSESLNNMKIIKLQAWQNWVLQKIEKARRLEHFWISRLMYLGSVSIFLLWLSPLAVSVTTFAACISLHIELTAGRVFTALATFRILQDPLRDFPRLLTKVAQATVAFVRLEKFLHEEELDPKAVERVPCGKEFAFSVTKGSFKWKSDGEEAVLHDINLQIKPSTFVAVVGQVGSGKSALLAAILGEMEKVLGMVEVSGCIAYVPQSAWMQNGTIKENILFGLPFDEEKYLQTLHVCALESDLLQLPLTDQTEIGERGINLSGGQKQRIQLARAVYHNADIYLLDDIFSAVDVHTGSHLFKECIRGALTGKTTVLVTHQVEFLHEADIILVMKDGKIVKMGNYEELVENDRDFKCLIDAYMLSLNMVVHKNLEEKENTSIQNYQSKNLLESGLVLNAEVSSNDTDQTVSTRKSETSRAISHVAGVGLKARNPQQRSGGLINDEEREVGRVGKHVYWAYATNVFHGAHVLVLLSVQICWQFLQIASDFWLADYTAHRMTFKTGKFLAVYVFLAMGSGLFVLVRSILISFCGLKIAQKFYLSMIQSIFLAPMSFFDTTPTGRILSRSSTDQATIDIDLPMSYGSTFAMGFQVIGIIFVISRVTWQVLLVIIPCAWLYYNYQNYFIETSRELTRLEAITEAPIIHHFSETLAGVMTIRAFRHQERFMEANNRFLNTNVCISFHKYAANEWLGFRIETIGTIVFCSSAFLLVMLPRSLIKSEYVGLSLSYGLAFTGGLFSLIMLICDIEQKMVAIERIRQYSNISNEGYKAIEENPVKDWPSTGDVFVENLQLRYRPDTPLVLKGLNFNVRGGEKVAIVGRTGSGKSSFVLALFRIVEPSGGRILIDGIDTMSIRLKHLRSKLSIIPQDPTLFEGSVRSNVDPIGQFTDEEIWKALKNCQMVNFIREKEGKLNAEVHENGENWSTGQRQLLCLARALLRNSKVLVLDEATASVDTYTDLALQTTIEREFAKSTIITIAHRIPNVMNSDKVLVLDAGCQMEYGSPSSLLDQPSSRFASLLREYQRSSNSERYLMR